ncbi:peptidase inhibitor I9 [Murinocardiopsis flavida]|uniref:Peptidase inhibitor I9 n=1 Tax=Murinocardiopsis flavida TaxID=645275 RepID=A0A2P8DSH9_9ACTN|nr:peptidase inhibitor I9 [Murinocardiopsis flavida]
MDRISGKRTALGVATASLLVLPMGALGAGAANADEIAPLKSAGADAVAGEYIVVLEDGVSTTKAAPADLGIAKKDVNHTYNAAVQGYAADLSEKKLDEVRGSSEVAFVEEVGTVEANEVTWGLDRIDQEALPLDGAYETTAKGKGTNAYIIDTGIDVEHEDFGGRAEVGHDATGGDGADGQGHGTHVAGTVGSKTYGVAPEANLFGVKVLGDDGSGTTDDVVAGIDWVTENAGENAVANLSLGGGASQAIDDAVNSLAESGTFVAVAAGNESADAGNSSPARAEGVATVAAGDETDTSAEFTNFGEAVDIYAPGVGIESTVPGGGTEALDGTSMASPHVAGAAALYKSAEGDADQATIQSYLVDNATSDALQGVPDATVNKLLNVSGL